MHPPDTLWTDDARDFVQRCRMRLVHRRFLDASGNSLAVLAIDQGPIIGTDTCTYVTHTGKRCTVSLAFVLAAIISGAWSERA